MSTEPREFPTDGPIEASVRLGAGDVIVSAGPTDRAVVTVRPSDNGEASQTAAEQTIVDFSDGRLRVEAPERGAHGLLFRRSAQVRIELTLPIGSTLHCNTGSADVRLTGELGVALVNTGSGDITVDQISGDLTTKTGSGDLKVGRIGGKLTANSGSGDMSIQTAVGMVVANTASGDLHIDEAHTSLTVRTASGDIVLRSVRTGEVTANSASGDVVVGVPRGTGVWLDLNTVSGSTRSNLDMTGDQAPADTQLRLRVQTVSGDILINRAAAVA
jgi:DUF4097 and DUF4098 domain-containing protein YvlB